MHTTNVGSADRRKLPPFLLTPKGTVKVATHQGLSVWRSMRQKAVPVDEIDRFVYADDKRGHLWEPRTPALLRCGGGR
jgi:hypothetical protein